MSAIKKHDARTLRGTSWASMVVRHKIGRCCIRTIRKWAQGRDSSGKPFFYSEVIGGRIYVDADEFLDYINVHDPKHREKYLSLTTIT